MKEVNTYRRRNQDKSYHRIKRQKWRLVGPMARRITDGAKGCLFSVQWIVSAIEKDKTKDEETN